MKKIKSITLALSLLALSACGSGIQTQGGNDGDGNGLGNKTTATSFAAATVNQNVFSLGSDFPADIEIPSSPELRGTAFIAADGEALGVIPVDLETKKFSTQFKGLDAKTQGVDAILAWAKRVKILSPTQGLMLGGMGLVYFNPSSGEVYDSVDLTAAIDLSNPLIFSAPFDWNMDGVLDNEVSGSFSPSGADGLAVLGNRVFVSFNNYFFGNDGLVYSQGILRVFELEQNPPTLAAANPNYVALDCFNVTGLGSYQGKLLASCSGATKIENNLGLPLTSSKLFQIDPQNLQVEKSLDLGLMGSNYQAPAIRGDRGFIGSYAYSEVYEINLNTWTVLRGKNNPILLSQEPGDYITDQKIASGGDFLFVSSQNRSEVQAISLLGEGRDVLPQALDYQFEGNPGITGAGPMAIRPGIPGEDFEGADLWLLTSSPGTLSNAVTY